MSDVFFPFLSLSLSLFFLFPFHFNYGREQGTFHFRGRESSSCLHHEENGATITCTCIRTSVYVQSVSSTLLRVLWIKLTDEIGF